MEYIYPASPNWYCSRILDAQSDGLVIFGAKNSLYIFDVSQPKEPKFMRHIAGHDDRVVGVSLLKPAAAPAAADTTSSDEVTAAAFTSVSAYTEATAAWAIANGALAAVSMAAGAAGTRDEAAAAVSSSAATFVPAATIAGSKACSVGDDGKVRIWDLDKAEILAEHTLHRAKLTTVHWSSADPDLIASGDEKGGVIMYTVSQRDGWMWHPEPPHTHVFALEFSPYFKTRLAVGFKTGAIMILDVSRRGNTVLARLRGHDDEVHSLVWFPIWGGDSLGEEFGGSAPCDVIASSCRDKTIRVWNAVKGQCVQVLRTPGQNRGRDRGGDDSGGYKQRGWVALAWPSGDKPQLVSSGSYGEIICWNLFDQQLKQKYQIISSGRNSVSHNRMVFNFGIVSRSNTSTLLVSTSMDRQIIVWDLTASASVISIPSLGGFVYSIAPSPLDPGRCAVGVGDSLIRVCSTVEPYSVQTYWQGIRSKVTALAWHPSKEGLLGYGTEDGRVGILDIVSSKSPVVSCTYHKRTVYVVTWGIPLHGNSVESIFEEDVLSLYSVGDGIILEHSMEGFGTFPAKDIGALLLRASCQLGDGSEAGGDGRKVHTAMKTEMSWKPDLNHVAVGYEDGRIEIFAVRRGLAQICTIRVHRKLINCIRWHPKFTLASPEPSRYQYFIATGSNESTVNIFNLEQVIESRLTLVACPSDTDNELVASATAEKAPVAKVTVPTVMESYRRLEGHSNKITALNWSCHEDGLLVSASYDWTVQVWDIKRSEEGGVGRKVSDESRVRADQTTSNNGGIVNGSKVNGASLKSMPANGEVLLKTEDLEKGLTVMAPNEAERTLGARVGQGSNGRGMKQEEFGGASDLMSGGAGKGNGVENNEILTQEGVKFEANPAGGDFGVHVVKAPNLSGMVDESGASPQKGDGHYIANFRGHHGRLLSVAWSMIDPDVVYSGADDYAFMAWRISSQTDTRPPSAKKRTYRTKPKSSPKDHAANVVATDGSIHTANAAATDGSSQAANVAATFGSSQAANIDTVESVVDSVTVEEAGVELKEDEREELLALLESKRQILQIENGTGDAQEVNRSPRAVPSTDRQIREKMDSGSDSDDGSLEAGGSGVNRKKSENSPENTVAMYRKKKAGRKSLFPKASSADNRGKQPTQLDCVELTKYKFSGTKPASGGTEWSNGGLARSDKSNGAMGRDPKSKQLENSKGPQKGTTLEKHLGCFSDRRLMMAQCRDEELNHRERKSHESLTILQTFRGAAGEAVGEAAAEKRLDDFTVALAAGVSLETWESSCESYSKQLTAEGFYHKAATYLVAVNKIHEAVRLLRDHSLYRDAVSLARLRLSPSDALLREVLGGWGHQLLRDGNYELAAKCFISVGEASEAANSLARRADRDSVRSASLVALAASQVELSVAYAQKYVLEGLVAGDWLSVIEFVESNVEYKCYDMLACTYMVLVRKLAEEEFGLSMFDSLPPENWITVPSLGDFSSTGTATPSVSETPICGEDVALAIVDDDICVASCVEAESSMCSITGINSSLPSHLQCSIFLSDAGPWQALLVNGRPLFVHLVCCWLNHLGGAVPSPSLLEEFCSRLIAMRRARQSIDTLPKLLLAASVDVALGVVILLKPEMMDEACGMFVTAAGCMAAGLPEQAAENFVRLVLPVRPPLVEYTLVALKKIGLEDKKCPSYRKKEQVSLDKSGPSDETTAPSSEVSPQSTVLQRVVSTLKLIGLLQQSVDSYIDVAETEQELPVPYSV